jgi:mRNA interferase MazF
LVVSPQAYNGRTGLALCCPITSKRKGYPFEVAIPEGLEVRGVILSDQVKSFDWRARRAAWFAQVPRSTTLEVTRKLETLLDGPHP